MGTPSRTWTRSRRSLAGPLPPALALVTLLGATLAGIEIALFIDGAVEPLWVFLSFTGVAVGYLAAGVLAWWRRPSNRTGALLCLCAVALLAAAAGNIPVPALVAAGFLMAELPIGVLLHLLLAFPSGRLPDRASRALVGAGYVVTVGLQVPQVLFGGDPNLPGTLVVATRPDLVAGAELAQSSAGVVVIVLAAALLLRRLRSADLHQRRTLAAVAGYGTFTILFLVGSANVARLLGVGPLALFVAQLVVVAGVPFAFGTGVLRGGFARSGEIEELGAWLGTNDGGRPGLREALGGALGDPSLELLFWLPDAGVHVDAAGTRVDLPGPDSGRAAVDVELAGSAVGAIAYDSTLLADPELVAAAGRVVALAIERERLTAQLLAGRAALRESRARIVSSADGERRRIAGDLHDGLQARLVVLAMQAGRVAAAASTPASVGAQVGSLAEGLEDAIAELRGLVHGIVPALLLERGLVAAIEDLVRRAPLRTRLDLPEQGWTLPAPVEGTGYFVVAEALTNAVKHAQATELRVRLGRANGNLTVEVCDNGVGGARMDGGAGLRGIADRVDVLGGRFAVDSRPGDGTRLVVELPCGS